MTYGTATGRFLAADGAALEGYVRFTPEASVVLVEGVDPSTVPRAYVDGVLDSQGYVCDPDNLDANGVLLAGATRGVPLLIPEAGVTNPESWTYRVDPALTHRGQRVQYQPWSVEITATGLDLATAAVVPSASGEGVTRGLSAYEVWLSLGNTGTLAEYQASLVGPPGPAPDGGTAGQLVVKTDTGIGWTDPASGGSSSFELRGTGSPEGAVTADPGYYYTDKAGTTGAWRWIKLSGTGNTGWRVVMGDTGWRNVREGLTWAANFDSTNQVVAVRRVNDTIYWHVSLSSTDNPGNVKMTIFDALSLGAMWLPSTSAATRPLFVSFGRLGTDVITEIRAALHAGSLKAHSGYIDHSMRGSWSHGPESTDWPTVLPGTAA